jgi:hypothetical protein
LGRLEDLLGTPRVSASGAVRKPVAKAKAKGKATGRGRGRAKAAEPEPEQEVEAPYGPEEGEEGDAEEGGEVVEE